MATAEQTELVRRLADDFTALQDAVLARMNGVCAPDIAAALEDASLAGPIVVGLAHADVLARGAVRIAELSAQTPGERHRLRVHARKVRRARSQAEAAYKEQCARMLAGRHRPVETLELRVARMAYPEVYAEAMAQELRDRGLPDGTPQAPESDLVRWFWDRRAAVGGGLPEPVRELRDCDEEAFVQALLRDARDEENPHLLHDTVVERWSRQARTALAWGRYAIGQAERDVHAASRSARQTRLHALEDAYQDAAVLAARAREARIRVAELQDRMWACTTTEPVAGLAAECRAAALTRFADARPELWETVQELTAQHQECPEQADGCPRCHRALAAPLVESGPADSGENEDDDGPTAVPVDGDRYAVLADLPDNAAVAVADATVNDESALCGYGWAAEDGATGYGDSLASSSGEAEIIGICAAALSLLDRHEDVPVVVLCDSIQAVLAVSRVLRTTERTVIPRALLFPEGRELMEKLLLHRHRVQVRWLKGHVGHDLNEAADAFAGLALRRVSGRILPAAARREETRILRSLGSGAGTFSIAA